MTQKVSQFLKNSVDRRWQKPHQHTWCRRVLKDWYNSSLNKQNEKERNHRNVGKPSLSFKSMKEMFLQLFQRILYIEI